MTGAPIVRLGARILSSGLDYLDWLSGDAFIKPNAHVGEPVGIGIVGCGFVADFYAASLASHPELAIKAAFDLDRSRAERLIARTGGTVCADLDQLLGDPAVSIIVNLTNPTSHAQVTRAALEAGKHVYSEKPLALDLGEASALVDLAKARGVLLGCAPCTALGDTAQAVHKAIKRGDIGTPRLVYAELDDGPIHKMQPWEWASPQGTPWPWQDELKTGCTLEHAGYHLSWMVMMFGPIVTVSGFSRLVAPDKTLPEGDKLNLGSDFSVGCLTFSSGVTARLTCSTVAPHDHRFRVIGDEGEIFTDACWNMDAPVWLRRFSTLGLRAETYPVVQRIGLLRRLFGLDGRLSDMRPRPPWRGRFRRHHIDYALGIADLARAMQTGRQPALSGENALHVTAALLAIDRAGSGAEVIPSPTVQGPAS